MCCLRRCRVVQLSNKFSGDNERNEAEIRNPHVYMDIESPVPACQVFVLLRRCTLNA
jgi:hypothetical protein